MNKNFIKFLSAGDNVEPEILKDKVSEIVRVAKYDGYGRELVPMAYKVFDKKSTGSGINFIPNQQLADADELLQPVIRAFEKGKVYSSFKDNMRGADFADTQLIIKCNKETTFSLCAIIIFGKYAWVVPLNNKKMQLCYVLENSKRKPNKIWYDQGS